MAVFAVSAQLQDLMLPHFYRQLYSKMLLIEYNSGYTRLAITLSITGGLSWKELAEKRWCCTLI